MRRRTRIVLIIAFAVRFIQYTEIVLLQLFVVGQLVFDELVVLVVQFGAQALLHRFGRGSQFEQASFLLFFGIEVTDWPRIVA